MVGLDARSHPTGAALASVRTTLAGVADVPVHLLTPDQKRQTLRDMVAAESQLAELKLRLIAGSSDITEQRGHRDVATWLAQHTNIESNRARSDQATATSIDARWTRIREAMANGRMTLDQAKVVARGLDQLASRPEVTDHTVLTAAEVDLVNHATGDHPAAPPDGFGPRQLRLLAERILHVVAPDIADEADARHLERLEDKARKATKLTIKALGDGITRITAIVPDHIGIRLQTYLEAFTSPRQHNQHTHDGEQQDQQPNPFRRDDTTSNTESNRGEGDCAGSAPVRPRVPRPRAFGQAFCSLLELLDPAKLPEHGGNATTVMITMTLDQLRRDIGAADILGTSDDSDTLTRLSPTELRRLACNGGIIPAVLGGKGEVLDLGREQRYFNRAQRKALRIQDQTCRAEGCTIPAAWTEAHHDQSWADGGPTDLANAVSLCSHHHHREHDPAYRTEKLPNGDRRYYRRT